MAYKFQVGAFRASGSLTAEGNLLADASVLSGSSLSLAGTAVTATAAEINIIDGDTSAGTSTLDPADGFIHNDGGVMKQTEVIKIAELTFSEMGGDCTVASNGDLTIAAGAVEHSMLNDNIISGQGELAHADIADADDMLIHDATDSVVKKVGVDSLGNHYFGQVSGDATIADGGALTIAANAVEGTMLNGNVAGDGIQIASNAIAVDVSDFAGTGLEDDGSENLRLSAQGTGIAGGAGSTLSVAAAQTSITSILNASFTKLGTAANEEFIDFGTSNQIKFGIDNTEEMVLAAGGLSITNGLQVGAGESIDTSGAGAILIGDATATSVVLGRSGQEVRVAGDLIVQGTTKSINSTTIEITSSFTFEGSTANDFETTLGVVDPTADRTINLADVGGTLIPFAAASTTAIAATPAELNLLDSDVAIGAAVSDLADSDGFIVEDGNTMKKIQLGSLKTFIGAGEVSVTSGSSGAANFALQKGVNYYGAMGGAATAVLLTGSSMSEGESIKIKAGPDCSVTNTLTISTLGSDTIDGTEDHIVLESPNAAVEFVYVAQGDYRIF